MTYDDFVTQLANMLVITPTDANFVAQLPNIINDAEQRIYRELDLLATVVRDSTAHLTANNRLFTFPQHFVVTDEINIFTPAGATTQRRQLVPTTREFLNAVYPNDTADTDPSIPEYYAMVTDQSILVGPSPDDQYIVEVTGTVRPEPLSSSNTETWLTLYLPDLFFAGALVFGYGYMKDYGAMSDDPASALSWDVHFKELLSSANTEETRKKYASQGWTSKNPTMLATPPR
jgi:hypothetical protein